MKAKLKKSIENLFTPEFQTAIGGQSVRISRKDLIKYWPKYIYTPAASVYENLKELRQKFKDSKGNVTGIKAVVLDMSTAKSRGTAFSQPTQKEKDEEAIKAFQTRQKTNIDRLNARKKAQIKRERKLVSDAKSAERKKQKRDAEKTSS